MACGLSPEIWQQVVEQHKADERRQAQETQRALDKVDKLRQENPVTATDTLVTSFTDPADQEAGGRGEEGGGGGHDPAYDWTKHYKRWDQYEDPEELVERAEKEKTKLENMKRGGTGGARTTCSHDHSAERRIVDLGTEGQLKACRDFRRRGNAFYEEGQYQRAALQYRKVIVYFDYCFPETDEERDEMGELRLTSLVNSAACFLKLHNLAEALEHCDQALQEDPACVKALFRRAQVYRHRDLFAEAKADLQAAARHAPPGDAAHLTIRREHTILCNKVEAYRSKSSSMSKTIFGFRENASGGDDGGGEGDEEEARRLRTEKARQGAAAATGGYAIASTIGPASATLAPDPCAAAASASSSSPPPPERSLASTLSLFKASGEDDLYRPVTVSQESMQALLSLC